MSRRPSSAAMFWALGAMAAVLWFYTWTVSGANGLQPATGGMQRFDYYNHLVHGLQKGHLYLDIEVPEALKALPDPYDPAANRDIGQIDTSYYRGHYYLYFGPAPAVTLMLPYRIVTGSDLPAGWAVLIFTCVGFVVLASLWLSVRTRYFVTSPAWTAPVGVLVLGFACMVGAVLRRPLFWEVAVAGGFAFGMLALAATYRALHDERKAGRWLVIAGIFLGLAAASRPTYLFGAALLLVPVWYHWRSDGRSGVPWRLMGAVVVPFGAMVAVIMAYNYARFDNPLEFGHNYQLSVAYESKVRQFSPAYFFYNLRLYYFLPARWSWQFPFAAPTPTPMSEWPAGYYTVDDVFGLFPVFPFACLSLVAPFALTCRAPSDRRQMAAVLAIAGALWIGIGGVMLFFVAAVARYMIDFVPAVALLAAIGFLAAESRTRNSWRRWPTRILIFGVVGSTIAGSAVANFELGRTLPERAPALAERISGALSYIESACDALTGKRFGPLEAEIRFPLPASPHVETLFRLGLPPTEDRVLVEYLSDQRVRFGVSGGGSPTVWGRSQRIAAGQVSRIRFEIGAFYPHLGHRFYARTSYAQASALRHQVRIDLDGNPVLQTYGRFYDDGRRAPRAFDPEFSGNTVSLRRGSTAAETATLPAIPSMFLQLPAHSCSPGQRLPLLATGHAGAGDVLFLDVIDARHARLGYDHWAAPVVMSDPFSFDGSVAHRFELRQDETHWALPANGRRLLDAKLDGVPVWHTYVSAYACAPDDVAFGRNPNGHSTCSAELSGLSAIEATRTATEAGGRLLLRVVLPPGEKRAWVPLLTIGSETSDSLSIGYIDFNAIELRFLHRGGDLIFARRIDLDANAGHDLELSLPSFKADSFGQAASGDVVVWWDGVEVLRSPTSAVAFRPEDIHFGERPVSSTMTAKYFPGAIVSHEWVQ